MPQKPDPIELLYAYSNGYFPMAHPEQDNMIYWHRPKMRGMIPLESFHVSRNLKKLYEKKSFKITMNQDFEGVIRACSKRNSTWISKDIIQAYTELFKMDNALSVEVWQDEALVGGLYGVRMKKAFFGESMFSVVSNTSKLALCYLVDYMKSEQMILLDTQYLNEHLRQFGAIEIPDEKYMDLLQKALAD